MLPELELPELELLELDELDAELALLDELLELDELELVDVPEDPDELALLDELDAELELLDELVAEELLAELVLVLVEVLVDELLALLDDALVLLVSSFFEVHAARHSARHIQCLSFMISPLKVAPVPCCPRLTLWNRMSLPTSPGEIPKRAGVALALVHVLTAYAWLDTRLGEPLPAVLASGKLAICWPFWQGCADAHVLGPDSLRAVVLAYGALGLVCAVLWRRGHRAAHGLHLALELVKVALIAQDFRLRHNAHTMATFAAAALLLARKPKQALPIMVTLFYVWAGLLKLTPDWLDGLALPTLPIALPMWLVALSCQAVVVLELAFVWGLLAQDRRWRWLAVGLLGAFHAASWAVVGYFYPLVMAALLVAVWICREGEPSLLTLRLEPSTWLLVGTLSLLQCLPRMLPGDTALTGEGRWMALHMFDAKVSCHAALSGAGGARTLTLPDPLRIHCDPIVVTARAQALCAERGWTQDPTLTLTLDAKRASATREQRVLALPGFCTQPPRYQALGHNPWIRAD